MMNTALSISAETRRLIWRCRRGMLELDIVLKDFLTQYPQLNEAELQVLDAFLELPDQIFWALIVGADLANVTQAELKADLTTDETALLSKINAVSANIAT